MFGGLVIRRRNVMLLDRVSATIVYKDMAITMMRKG